MTLSFLHKLTVCSLICFTLTGLKVISQQENHYLLENFVPFRNNPAYTGNRDMNDLMVMSRRQWTGFEGAPTYYLLAAHFVLRNKNAAIGTDLQNNSTGPVKETRIFLGYSYKVILSEKSSLSLGLKVGVGIFQINLSDLLVIDQGDKLFETDIKSVFLPNVGTGLHFVYQNFYFDFSIPKLLRNNLTPKGVQKINNGNKEDRTFITGGGAKFQIAEEMFLHPAITLWMVKGTAPLFETRILATYKKMGVGLSFRPLSALGGYFDFLLWDDIKIGYAYELPTSMSKGALSGSHEVYIGYNFSFTKQKTLSPRRF